MSLLKDVDVSEIKSLKLELEFSTPEKLIHFLQQSKDQNSYCQLTFSRSKNNTFEAAVEVCKRSSQSFTIDMHVDLKEDQSITIPGIDAIYINFSYLSKKPDIDCPGAKVYLSCDSNYFVNKVEAETLSILLNSASKLRNLPFFYTSSVDIGDEFKLNFLIRFMSLVCCGVCGEENMWNFFLTRELYDPRILGGIAAFN